jgi:4-amino-4-deoxy-L-arabinose transferase-like glycosyltransferase
MKTLPKLPSSPRTLLLILVVVYLLTRLPLLFYLPFIQDEALYAVMISEQAENPALIPTFLDYPVGWKPAPFFWLHVPFNELPLPLEAKLRLPSMLAGLISIPVVFRLLQNVGISKNAVFFTMLLFLFSLVTSYPHTALLTDSILFLFISSALLLYTEKSLGQWRFLGAAVLTILAFFTKLFLAMMIPVLAIAYFYGKERTTLKKPTFLLSLLAIPLSIGIYYMIFSFSGQLDEVQFSIGANVANPEGLVGQLRVILGAMGILLEGAGIWFALSLFGFHKHWKENLFMSLWYVLSIFPMLTGSFMPWYFLPVAPAISYFAVKRMLIWKGREKLDTLFWAFFSMALLLTLALNAYIYVFELNKNFYPQKEVGLLMAGKDNVLIIGIYYPGISAYKIMNEPEPKDFGWILVPRNASDAVVATYILDYHSDTYQTQDGSFGSMFSTSHIFRKDTSLTEFDYVVIIGRNNIMPRNSEIILNKSDITIHKLSQP